MNQFRALNRPAFFDVLWSGICAFRYRKKKVFFEFGSMLYRFRKNLVLEQNVYIKRNAIIGCANGGARLKIGENTTVGFGTCIVSSLNITIGRDCMIAPYVYIVDSNHGMAPDLPFNKQENKVAAVVIEDNVWIGAHSVILPGVRIASGSIVGANSTVTKSITSPGVYVGSPAKKIA